jgi:hypothetical protein
MDSLVFQLINTTGPVEKEIKKPDYLGIYGWHTIKNRAHIVESSKQYADTVWYNYCTITSAYMNVADSLYLVIKDITRNRLLGGLFGFDGGQ